MTVDRDSLIKQFKIVCQTFQLEIVCIASGFAMVRNHNATAIVTLPRGIIDPSEFSRVYGTVMNRFNRGRFNEKHTFDIKRMAKPSDCMTWEQFDEKYVIDSKGCLVLRQTSQA
jgi:hypothetical protein